MKSFTHYVCILCAISFLFPVFTSCKRTTHEESVTFSFKLTCSEELLDFVVPTATYVDEKGEQQVVVLSKSSFSNATNKEGLVNQSGPILYEWGKIIKLSNTHTGQRDMQVSYKVREDVPQIDNEKVYDITHALASTHSQEYEEVVANSSITLNMGISSNEVKGENLPKYLENLEKTPDYKKEEAK